MRKKVMKLVLNLKERRRRGWWGKVKPFLLRLEGKS